MKGLEAFEEIKIVMTKLFGGVERSEKALNTIEKELKALEIIKNKLVSLFHLAYTDTKEAYNDLVSEHYRELTKEEYDLLKEVLL